MKGEIFAEAKAFENATKALCSATKDTNVPDEGILRNADEGHFEKM